ncbi:MAG: iron ABC transporter permease [Bacteroidales bacterium]|nr:iron ABC transporter permease [Bacteroidales bacterium]MBN2698450.1 iron ABC transporter permease [Bacteroidales bacterium]
MKGRGHSVYFVILGFLIIFLTVLDLTFGSVKIPLSDLLNFLSANGQIPEEHLIILKSFRIPRIVTALLAGASLSVCGLQMQTLFRNPLAGPYILGISSGASFGAALVIIGFGTTGILSGFGMTFAAWIGAGMVMLLLLFVSVRIKQITTILILGIMFSSGLSAIINIMQYFSEASELKSFVIWTMGSLGSVTGSQLMILSVVLVPGLIATLFSMKSLNGLMLGESYATTMGLRIIRARTLIFITTSILAGTVTAFCGPIGFIGIAVPHITRFIFGKSDHRILLPATILTGMVIMLASDILSQLPGSDGILPINAVTSLIGIPVVIWIVLRGRKTAFT